jgi:predicted transport protein
VNRESDHFIGKDLIVKKLYKHLTSELLKFGFLRIEPTKAGIAFHNHSQFANIVVRPSYLNVEFKLNRFIDDPERFVKVLRVGDKQFSHTVQLSEEQDLTDDCLAWIREAYQLHG